MGISHVVKCIANLKVIASSFCGIKFDRTDAIFFWNR